MPNKILSFAAIAYCFSAGCSSPQFVAGSPSKDKEVKSTAAGEGMSKGNANAKSSTAAKPGAETIRGPFAGQKPAQAAPEAVGDPKPIDVPENTFAVAGQSFDLHAIFDVSDSLSHPIVGTDINCLRYSAFKTFVGALKNKLGDGADARLSITTFSDEASFKGTHEGFLEMTESQFDKKFKNIICKSDGKTNVAAALKVAADEARPLLMNSPKQVASVLFFSDGNPTKGSMEDTLKKAENLRQLFKNRVFGIRLTGTQSSIFFNDTEDFMKKVVGSKKRVREVKDAGDLAASMVGFLD
jgi:hypothetical protein